MRSNLKLVGRKIGTKVIGNREFDLIQTTIIDKEIPCKKCKKNNRRHGSSYCKECTVAHKIKQINDGRLQDKINKQINNNVI